MNMSMYRTKKNYNNWRGAKPPVAAWGAMNVLNEKSPVYTGLFQKNYLGVFHFNIAPLCELFVSIGVNER